MTTPAAVVFDPDGPLCTGQQDDRALSSAAFDAAGVERFGRPGGLGALL